ncbi:GDNF family receptor alpha-2a [Brachyhypopomus gauderio]|uniref:GDNF family receptor alpha-2a n=1 Tax=Brachyhypopomus gauderio TaxID=698409 RepID=UPI00404328C0
MYIWIYSLLLLLDKVVVTMSSSSGLSVSGAQEGVDCVKASELCNQSPQCSSRHRIMRQCLVGKDWNTMLANKECQAALEVLQDSPLYECRCKRGMKKELQCLQSFWSIHMGLSEGEDFYEMSPYEPLPPVRLNDALRLASITAGMHTGAGKSHLHCLEPGRTCNQCLDATKSCNLNENCKRQRSNYITTCTRSLAQGQHGSQPPPQQLQDSCNRKRCHKALRQFLERVESQYTFGLLFCSCGNQACAERRRQTIVPGCAYEDKVKPNCLQLRKTCRQDPLCRSRLADFNTNCQMTHNSMSSCPQDAYRSCLTAYTGLIGTDMTPNYENAQHDDLSISPWCNCDNSGNQEEECDRFLLSFRNNSCLRNAIQAFGLGTDVTFVPKTDSPATVASVNTESDYEHKPTDNPNSSRPVHEENWVECSSSKSFICAKDSTEAAFVENGFDPRNRSLGLKLCVGLWLLSLMSVIGISWCLQ